MIKTRRLVTLAVLSALSFVLMLVSFPLIPGADFLKVEFSILPVLMALVLFDLKSAYTVLLLRTLLKFVLANRGVNDLIGLPMNVLALGIFVLAFALIWKKNQTKLTYLSASLLGSLVLTVSMILLNLVYAIPLYAQFANFDIGQMIGLQPYLLGMVLPFNLAQGLLFSLAFGLLYAPVKPFLIKYQYEK